MNIVGSVPGWAAAVSIIGDAEYSPRQTGLNIAMRVGSDPAEDENASALKAAFQKAGFRPNYILDDAVDSFATAHTEPAWHEASGRCTLPSGEVSAPIFSSSS